MDVADVAALVSLTVTDPQALSTLMRKLSVNKHLCIHSGPCQYNIATLVAEEPVTVSKNNLVALQPILSILSIFLWNHVVS